MIIKKTKTTVAVAIPVALMIFVGSVQTSAAGVFNNLVNAANGALPAYGRDTVRANRADLTAKEISAAIREALKTGADNVVLRFAAEGYSDNSIRIELPRSFLRAQKISARIGYSKEFDELERKLNVAALAAAPATRDLINRAVERLEFDDPRGILNGNNIAATQHLRVRVNARLIRRLKPIVNELLAEAGALESSVRIAERIGHLPMVKNLKTDLADHVVEESLDGFFHYLAKEEQGIRLSPVRRTSDLLRRVFG